MMKNIFVANEYLINKQSSLLDFMFFAIIFIILSAYKELTRKQFSIKKVI